jgi:hypothetical protein
LEDTRSDRAGGTVEQYDIALGDVGDVQHLCCSRADEQEVGCLREVESGGLREHVGRADGERGRVTTHDLEGHNLVTDRPASRGKDRVVTDGGDDAGDLVTQSQRKEAAILARTYVLEVGRVHASGSYLDRDLAQLGRLDFDCACFEHFGSSEIGCHPPDRHRISLRSLRQVSCWSCEPSTSPLMSGASRRYS